MGGKIEKDREERKCVEYEISETAFVDPVVFLFGGTAESFDPLADSGKHLWSGAFVCGAAYRDHQTASGEGNRKVFDRNHVDPVYSGGGRASDKLGRAVPGFAAGVGDHRGIHRSCYGDIRKGHPDCNSDGTKTGKKEGAKNK